MRILRQGDILLKEIKQIPKGLKKKDNILAYGEVTGHKHKLVGNARVLIDNNGRQFIDVVESSDLQHEEHHNLVVDIGKYEIIQQREYDVVEGIRQVMD